MSKTVLILLAVGAVAVIFGLILLIWGVSTSNKEVRLRNQIMAKQKDNSSEYDNMWKKISQVAQVTDAQKEALKEIFVGYAKARSGDGSGKAFVNAVHEAIPNVDTSTFNNLMNIIVASRDAFTMRQKEILDLKREHDNMLDTFPSGFLLSSLFGREKIDVTIVTSIRTEEAFRSGKDDDTDVFQKTKPAEKK